MSLAFDFLPTLASCRANMNLQTKTAVHIVQVPAQSLVFHGLKIVALFFGLLVDPCCCDPCLAPFQLS